MSRALLQVALLTAVYATMIGSGEPIDLATGALFGTVFLGLGGYFGGRSGGRIAARAVAFVPWAAVVGREVAQGTWQVAAVALGLRSQPRAGIIAIPLGERTPRGAAVSGLAATLSPGELLIEIDYTERVLYLHVMDATDPDAVRSQHQRIYERYQRRVFP